MAETGGFEPPIRCDPYNGLANRRLQPLGHVSGRHLSVATPGLTRNSTGSVELQVSRPGNATGNTLAGAARALLSIPSLVAGRHGMGVAQRPLPYQGRPPPRLLGRGACGPGQHGPMYALLPA